MLPLTTVTDAKEFRDALVEAFKSDGPRIVEAIVDSSDYDALVLHQDKT